MKKKCQGDTVKPWLLERSRKEWLHKMTKLTILDIAERAGVSKSTVSLVLRGSNQIKAETKKRVLQVVQETGYVYNRHAASMRSKKSKTIGYIVTDINSLYCAELLRGVESVLDSAGYSILIASASNSPEKQERQLIAMLEYGVDGLLLAPSYGSTSGMLKDFQNMSIPCVLISRSIDGTEMDFVGTDNVFGVQQAMRHLYERGSRKFGFINYDLGSTTGDERLQGYRMMLENYSLTYEESQVIHSSMTLDGGKAAMMELMQRDPDITGVICYTDIIACGAASGLKELGIPVGNGGVSIIGHDNVDIASYWNPRISTIATFPVETGKRAANMLLQRIKGSDEPPQKILIQPKLIERESS